MNTKALSCPNCGAALEIEDGLDTFFVNIVVTKSFLKVKAMRHIKRRLKLKVWNTMKEW